MLNSKQEIPKLPLSTGKTRKYRQFLKTLSRLLHNLSFKIFPGFCLLCGTHSERSKDLCLDCENDLPVNQLCCPRCAIPLIHTLLTNTLLPLNNSQLCGQCISESPPFDQCLAPLRYEFPINLLVSRFKYRGKFCNGVLLADILLNQILSTQSSEDPDLIVPVPLHWQRQFVRGFNQSHWLAKYLGHHLNIPVNDQLLKRCRKTSSQKGLKRKQRQKNLKGAFQVNGDITGKRIALVDDVVTTGSTVTEISKLLKKAGAMRIEIWSLARTPLEK